MGNGEAVLIRLPRTVLTPQVGQSCTPKNVIIKMTNDPELKNVKFFFVQKLVRYVTFSGTFQYQKYVKFVDLVACFISVITFYSLKNEDFLKE